MKRSHNNNYFGMYQGIVVQNDDPEFGGKVKVFVPDVSPSVYKQWALIKGDKKFRFIGKNIKSDLSDIIQQLRIILPWAKCASPLTSEDASGRYNSNRDFATVSDSNTSKGFFDDPTAKTHLNIDKIGNKPGYTYELEQHKATDGFFATPTEENKLVNNPNPFGASYKPSVYNNAPKGMFGVPSVGAHVWVFFERGDANFPVYWAISHGTSEWNEIYEAVENEEGLDYPGDFENSPTTRSNYTQDLSDYRNKFVINQKGGTLEIVNSDKRERINISHASGSHIEMNHFVTSQLCTNNDQKLVLKDQYLTVKGCVNNFTGMDKDDVTKGDVFIKIGNQDIDTVSQIKSLLAPIANIKQLFDIQRCKPYSEDGINYTSTLQKQVGTAEPNPTLMQKHMSVNNDGADTVQAPDDKPDGTVGIASSSGNIVSNFKQVSTIGLQKDATSVMYPLEYTNMLPTSNSSANGTWAPDVSKETLLKTTYTSNIPKIAKLESKLGLGGSQIINITKHKVENVGLIFNDFPSMRIDKSGKNEHSRVMIDDFGMFIDRKPTPLIEYVHVDSLPGGNYDLNTANRYCLTVGSGGVHIKTTGGIDMCGGIVNINGSQLNLTSKHEVNVYSDSRVHVEGDVVSLKQKNNGQVLVDSSLGVSNNAVVAGSVNVGGELYVQHITAPVEYQETENMRLFGKPYSPQPGTPLGKSGGKRIGTAYIKIIRDTDLNIVPGIGTKVSDVMDAGAEAAGAHAGAGMAIPSMGTPGPALLEVAVYSDFADEDSIVNYPHSHLFKNLPLDLVQSNSDVRHEATRLNTLTEAEAPKSQNHCKKDI